MKMDKKKSSKSARICLAFFLLGMVIPCSGCGIYMKILQAQINSAPQRAQEYRNQAKQYSRDAEGYNWEAAKVSRDIYSVKKLLAEQNSKQQKLKSIEADIAKLERRCAELTTEIETGSAHPSPAAQIPPDPYLQELGRIISAEDYKAAVEDLKYLQDLEKQYQKRLQALATLGADSPSYARAVGVQRAQSLLDMISEALVAVNIPGYLKQKTEQVEDPLFNEAAENLVITQDKMIAALAAFQTEGGANNSNVKSAISACNELSGSISKMQQQGYALGSKITNESLLDMIVRLETMKGVTGAAAQLLEDVSKTGNMSTSISSAVQQISSLFKDNLPIDRPAHDAVQIGDRMKKIMAMCEYAKGGQFSAAAYLQIRLKEIRTLKKTVGQVVESYKNKHS